MYVYGGGKEGIGRGCGLWALAHLSATILLSRVNCFQSSGRPGGRHDAWVYDKSSLREKLEAREFFPEVGHIASF